MQRASQRLVVKWVRSAAKKLGFTKPILWLFTPSSADYVGKLDEDLMIYHCLDDYSASPHWNRFGNVAEQERQLQAQADLVITCSDNLFEQKAKECSEIINVPNAVDFDLFYSTLDERTPVAPSLAQIKSPIIGACGTMDFRFDEALLAKAARRYPEYHFVLVGPVPNRFPGLESLPNVTFLGKKPREELPSYLKAFDVCLIPNRLNEFVKNTSPLKVYEFLAAGKPVVSPDIRGVQGFGDLVFVGRSHEEMIDMIQSALESDNPQLIKARTERARENTWQHRVNTVSDRIAQISGRKSASYR